MKGKKTGGRRPGSSNKTTVAVKDALAMAFEKMGGVPHLLGWGRKNPTEFYKLWAKLLPTQLTGADSKPLQLCIVERVVDARDEDTEGRPPAPGPTGLPQV